jgi:YVTN family beta-propeller protein
VSVISTSTNTVIDTISVGINPTGAAVSPDGNTVYVAAVGCDLCSFGEMSTISVINAQTDTVSANITPGAFGAIGVAVSPDSNRVYVTNFIDDLVWVIDTANNTTIATITLGGIPFGSSPRGITVSPDGSTVYTANYLSDNVAVINAATNTVATYIAIGTDPFGLSVTPDGSELYVANNGSSNANSTVSVVDVATNTVTANIPVGSEPFAFGNFIQSAPKFAGTPGNPNCHGKSVSALAKQYGGLPAAAAALGDSSVQVLQNDIAAYCAG